MSTSSSAGFPGRVGFGAATFGNLGREVTDDAAWEICEAAWAAGIRYFDTAPHYGLGLSERRLGRFLATKPREEFVLSTKVGRLLRPNPDQGPGELDLSDSFVVPKDTVRVWDASPAGVRASLEESLQRLGLDRVDVLYLHDPERYDPERGVEEGVASLVGVREEGLARAVGCGSMVVDSLTRAARTEAIDLLMVAGAFTLAAQPTWAQTLPACEATGTKVVVAAAFNSGLLSTPRPDPDAPYDYAPVAPAVLAKVNRIADVCEQHGVDLPTAALHYVFQHPVVTSVVVGAALPAHLRQNVDRLEAPVPDALWDDLRSADLIP